MLSYRVSTEVSRASKRVRRASTLASILSEPSCVFCEASASRTSTFKENYTKFIKVCKFWLVTFRSIIQFQLSFMLKSQRPSSGIQGTVFSKRIVLKPYSGGKISQSPTSKVRREAVALAAQHRQEHKARLAKVLAEHHAKHSSESTASTFVSGMPMARGEEKA